MIPKIKRLVNRLYPALLRVYGVLTIPGRPFVPLGRPIRSTLAKGCIAFGKKVSNPDTRGDFNWPRELAWPFFIAAMLTSLAIPVYYGFYWVDTIAKTDQTPLTVIASGAKMSPGFIATILLAGLSLSPLGYILTWGVGMLGSLLRKWEQAQIMDENRELRERVTELEGTETENQQLREQVTQSEQVKQTLRSQIRRSGQEPEA